MSEYDEHFVSDQGMKVMEPVNGYKAERDFTTLIAWQKAMNEGQNLIETTKITLNGYINFVKNQK